MPNLVARLRSMALSATALGMAELLFGCVSGGPAAATAPPEVPEERPEAPVSASAPAGGRSESGRGAGEGGPAGGGDGGVGAQEGPADMRDDGTTEEAGAGERTGIRFATLMRILCRRNDGTFVALNSTSP